MSVQQYFDRIAADFDSYYGEPSGKFQAWTNRILRKPWMLKRLTLSLQMLDRGPGQRILDIGCGSGVLAIPLAQSGHRVLGIDFLSAMIDIARERARSAGVSVDFRVIDFLAGDFPVMDSCVALGVLEYFGDPRGIIEKMLLQIRPGGLVVFDLPVLLSYHTPLRLPYLLWRMQRAYFYTRRGVRRLLAPFRDLLASTRFHRHGAGYLVVLERR